MSEFHWTGDESSPRTAVAPAPPAEHKEHRVIGPPGTGKTYYLSSQLDRLVQDSRYGIHNVLIGSLTRAAAKEITYAAGRRLGRDLPRETVGTLHAHAYRALDRPELAETGRGLKAWNEWLRSHGEPMIYRVDERSAKDIEWAAPEQQAGVGGDGDVMLAALAVMRARMTDPELWPPKLLHFHERWQRFKDDENMHDFSDLIERAINEVPVAPGNPKIIMFDEAQDSSRLEFTLLRKWGDMAEQLVVVGDPWQNLYEWRGSDPAAFFDRDAASQIVLQRSRRVPRAVRDFALGWLADSPDGMPRFDYQPRFNDPNDEASGEAAGVVEETGHTWGDPGGLVTRIEREAGEGKTVMVLTTCAYMLAPLISELRERGVPFGNRWRPQQGAWNPLAGVDRLLAFLRPQGATWGDESRPWTWEDAHKWVDPMVARGVWNRGSKTLIESKARPKDRFDDTPSRPADLATLMGMLASEEHQRAAMALNVDWWIEHLRDEKKRQAAYGARVFRQHGGRALRDRPRITVGTIHSVKGAETDVVYVFPDLSRQAWESSWFNPAFRAPVYRQFYVAFTRARDRLVLGRPTGANYVQFPITTQEA